MKDNKPAQDLQGVDLYVWESNVSGVGWLECVELFARQEGTRRGTHPR